MRTFWLTGSIVLGLFATFGTYAASPTNNCTAWVLGLADRGADQFESLDQISDRSLPNQLVTVFVRIPTDKIRIDLSSFRLYSVSTVQMPPEFIFESNGTFHAILRGRIKDLRTAANELSQRLGLPAFLDLAQLNDWAAFALPIPDLAMEWKGEMKPSDFPKEAVLWNGTDRKIYLIYNSDTFKRVPPEWLEQLKIRTENVDSLIDWLKQTRSPDEAILARSANQTALTLYAYTRLKSLEGQTFSKDNAFRLSQQLEDFLQGCDDSICTAALPDSSEDPIPSVSARELNLVRNIGNGHLRHMVLTLNSHSTVSLSARDALNIAMLNLAHRANNPNIEMEFRNSLTKVGLALWDGRALLNFLRHPQGEHWVLTRFVQAWKLLAQTLDPSLKDRPLSARSVESTLQRLQERPPVTPVEEPNEPPSSAPAAALPPMEAVLPVFQGATLSEISIAILNVLRRNSRMTQIYLPDGVRRAFLGMVSRFKGDQSRAQSYRQEINGLGFGTRDYGQLHQVAVAHNLATQRVLRGWHLLQALMDDPNIAEPITLRSIAAFEGQLRRPQGVGVASVNSAPQLRTPITAEPPKGGPALKGIARPVRKLLYQAGLQTDDINALWKNWHGITLKEREPGQVRPTEWTLLVYADHSIMGTGSDLTFPVKIENGVATEMLTDPGHDQNRFFDLAAEQLNIEPIRFPLNFEANSGGPFSQEVEVTANNLLKLKLKHNIDLREGTTWLNLLKIVGRGRKDGELQFDLKGPVRGQIREYFIDLRPTLANYQIITLYQK